MGLVQPRNHTPDHKDRDRLNNQRTNMHMKTTEFQMLNRTLPGHSSSHFGVNNHHGKWRAVFNFRGRRYQLSFPKTDQGLKDAIAWHRSTMKRVHGEYVENCLCNVCTGSI
jgi:hypothetical protein